MSTSKASNYLSRLSPFRDDKNFPLVILSSISALFLTTQLPLISRVVSVLLARLHLRWVLLSVTSSTPSEHGTGKGTVSRLFIHPVKSLRAVAKDRAVIGERGFVNDRKFMICTPAPVPLSGRFGPKDATHRFLTQRQCPSLATVSAVLNENESVVTLSSDMFPGMSVAVPTQPPPSSARYHAVIWSDVVTVYDMGDEAAAFLQRVLDHDDEIPDVFQSGGALANVRLVIQDPKDERSASEDVVPARARSLTGKGPSVALSDGYPILLACQSSLDELNRRLMRKGKPELPISRFRPNIVITGTEPFEEDYWKIIRIDGVVFHVVKACPRCKQSCTDQLTGIVSKEPVETMAEFRALHISNKENVYFAQNATPAVGSVGKTIAVGATVEVLQWGDPVYRD